MVIYLKRIITILLFFPMLVLFDIFCMCPIYAIVKGKSYFLSGHMFTGKILNWAKIE